MTPRICVDYLSYDWMSDELIRTRQEVRRQARKARLEKLSVAKEQKAYYLELFRFTRLENALWRQMARVCGRNLGGHNAAVLPSTLDWQKEADITWLYGPFISSSTDEADGKRHKRNIKPDRCDERKELMCLKPVLKKKSSREWYCLQPRTNSLLHANNVQFSQQIQEIHFSPDTPVLHLSRRISDDGSDDERRQKEEEETAEDDAMWILAVETGHWMKRVTYACVEYLGYCLRVFFTMRPPAPAATVQESRLSIVQAAAAIIQSILATLFLYREWGSIAEYVQSMTMQQRRQLTE